MVAEAKRTFKEELGGVEYKSMLPAEQKPPVALNRAIMEKFRPEMKKHYLKERPEFTCVVQACRPRVAAMWTPGSLELDVPKESYPSTSKKPTSLEFLDMPSCLQALRDVFALEAKGQANIVPRTRWPFGSVRLNVMGGGERPSKHFAVKSYGGGAFHVLFYAEDKGLLAIIEANTLGADPHRRGERQSRPRRWRGLAPARSR